MTSSRNDNAVRTLIVTADDYGLSVHNTDTIIEAVRLGAVTRVSALANGSALEYGLDRLASEAPTTELSVHVNLTEGLAIAPLDVVRPLTDAHGVFRYSVGTLWLRYLFAGTRMRARLQDAVRHEITAQFERIRSIAATHGLAIAAADGHQHVHMIPFIFDALIEQHTPYVRITSEPWYLVPGSLATSLGARIVPRIVLELFARRNRARAVARNIVTPDAFLSFIFSGRMTYESIAEGLCVAVSHCRIVEIGMHPGTALRDELEGLRHTNTEWHYSLWRARELELLISPRFAHQSEMFRSGSLSPRCFSTRLARIVRYIISGGTAASVNLLLLYLFATVIGVWYASAAALAYTLSIGVSFSLQKFWTFGDEGTNNLVQQLGLYTLVQLTNLAVYTSGVYVLVTYFYLWYLVAAFIMLILLACSSFFIFRKLLVSNTSQEV